VSLECDAAGQIGQTDTEYRRPFKPTRTGINHRLKSAPQGN